MDDIPDAHGVDHTSGPDLEGTGVIEANRLTNKVTVGSLNPNSHTDGCGVGKELVANSRRLGEQIPKATEQGSEDVVSADRTAFTVNGGRALERRGLNVESHPEDHRRLGTVNVLAQVTRQLRETSVATTDAEIIRPLDQRGDTVGRDGGADEHGHSRTDQRHVGPGRRDSQADHELAPGVVDPRAIEPTSSCALVIGDEHRRAAFTSASFVRKIGVGGPSTADVTKGREPRYLGSRTARREDSGLRCRIQGCHSASQ